MKSILITSIAILSFAIFLNSATAQYQNDVFIFQEHRFIIITLPPQIPFKVWYDSVGKGNSYNLDKIRQETGAVTAHNATPINETITNGFPLFYTTIFPGTATEISLGTTSSASKLEQN
ncbi:MAG: hypothetical protein U0586_08700 [Candidatus Brocadiaceae bacterium]